MLGSLRRLTLVTLLVLVSPSVLAASPVPNLPSAFSLGGQDVTDVAMDPTGQYVAGVVLVDPANVVTLPGQPRHDDIYPCQFGPPASASAGSGCRSPGLQHGSTRRTTQLGARQAVDYTSYVSGGLVARYAVAGPSDTLSLWSSISDTPLWEVTVPGQQAVVNVSLSPDAGRVLAGTVPASGAGRLVMYNGSASTGSTGVILWEFNLTSTRPVAMDYARSGAVAVVGASPQSSATGSSEVIIFAPGNRRPVEGQDLFRYDLGASEVTDVAVTPSGNAVVVTTTQHVFFFGVDPTRGKALDAQRWSRQVAGGCQGVTLASDASVFAAACGSRVLFFRHLDNELVGQDVGSFDAGAAVADLAYDASGDLLVAVAGNRVYGFGEARTTPIWSFDATENGGLDGPLRRVLVSDGGERIVVAGKTRLMPYRSVIGASAAFAQAPRLEVQPASNVKLSLTVTNKGSLADNYTFSARFPPGWNGFSPGPVRLDPEESATVNLTLDVPAGQAPGFYGVEVDVRSETAQRLGRDRVIVATPTLNLTVPRAIVLNLTAADDRVPPLRQGETVTVPITVRNRGNAEGVVNLSATQVLSRGAPWTLRFAQETIQVPAGGERTVNLDVHAPADAASGDRNDITVCAREGQPKTCTRDVTQTHEATRTLIAFVDPRFGAELTTNASTFEFGPGELKVVTVTLLNTGNTDDAYNLTATLTPAGVANDWHVTMERDFINVPRGEKRTVTVTVRPAVNDPRDASLIVKAISIGSALTQDGSLTISLVPRPPAAQEDKSLLPMPPVAWLLGLVAVAALLRRRGGR